MSKDFDGYKHARILEGAVSPLLKAHPPDKKENARDWLAFCRTLVTGLQLIEGVALNALKEKL
jgi:hypothetical protein